MNISDPTVVVVKKKNSQEFNLVKKNCFDESDEIKFLTKISCYTVCSQNTQIQGGIPYVVRQKKNAVRKVLWYIRLRISTQPCDLLL